MVLLPFLLRLAHSHLVVKICLGIALAGQTHHTLLNVTLLQSLLVVL